ncbi:type I-B CRISPR-associated protein Cas8b/Csh1 [Halapricum desulfuricans]|uniref:CRISPR-associated protein, large subunit of CASCADE complex, MTH1090 family n=1 Tax=Halapricum desulfuricans TaxID=2841257 RepID=A0A897MYG6_9EURY|nr:type I-B CRISPR-associated protein Cas8b/Csh1 [Halapricum desulfuricans]QSG05321.1 CRISPR-associated protein, large subunit of CASCADE complex, MTH1090 family [Halapricum desulfuricans]
MSSELTSEDFQQALNEYWHGRPPSSLEDVMALYGVLAVVESSGQLYRTPSALEPFIDDGRLVTIYLDLTDREPTVADIEQSTLREEHVSKLAYSHKSSGRGAKYSLTQIGSKNGNDADGVASTILSRIRSWTGQDSTQSLTGDDGHPDAWIIEKLADVFEKDSETLEGLKENVRSLLPEEESVPTAVTIRFKFSDKDVESLPSSTEEWVWPEDIEVLNEAMRRYATANAADKNMDNDSSEGQAVGVVTGEPSRVVGTPESPLEVYSVKHPDAQPGLRRNQSWRNYPVSPDTAMLFAKGQDLVEQCVYRRGGMETYAMPYFAGEMTGEKAEALYLAIDSIREQSKYVESGDSPMAQVTFRLQEHEDEAVRELAEQELRFYTVTMPISDDKHIVSEAPAADTYWITQLADALVDTLQGPTCEPSYGGFAKVKNSKSEKWPLLYLPDDRSSARAVAFYLITGHEFMDSVFAYRDDDEGDDFRRIADHRLISGQQLDASTLFDEYLRRYDDESEGSEQPSYQTVAQQLVHLETLSRAGLLKGIDAPIEPTDNPMTIDTDFDTSDLATIREHRLEAFLDRPLFADSEGNDARRATAVAGVLVGQISWHQENERSIGRPLDAATSGDQMTKNSLENTVTTALEKAKVYAQDSEHESDRDLLFPETVDELLATTDDMPTNWNIDKRELQFCYVLGHAHGRRSMPNAFDLYEGNDATGTEESTAEESSAD